MPRCVSFVSAVVVLLSVTALAVSPPVKAQGATPVAIAAHPVVGLWRTAVSNPGDTPFTSLSTFHADGTYIEVLPDGTITSGVWRPTGERTADLILYLRLLRHRRPAGPRRGADQGGGR